jgi:1-deoxy-D-xylulose-5-phosphate reductoisomerase
MNKNVDIVIFAIAGSSPLNLLIDILSSGKIIGIANKECIICLGKSLLNIASKSSTKIVPLDSEHNALFQLIKNKNKESIRKYTITASGGNFFNLSKSEMAKITPEQAVLHPKWKMGEKISIDSSTLMNKGLEIIEACILFNINSNKIDAIVHPESIIHGMIEFNDRSSHAFLSQPNMEIAISSVLYDDNIVNLNNHNLDLIKIKSLNFLEIDNNKFNAIKLAKFSLNEGGLLPAVLNYSNELMVQLFLNKKISFNEITLNNEIIMNKFLADGCNISMPTINDVNNLFRIVDSYVLASQSIID